MPIDETRQAAYEDLVSRGYFKRNPDKEEFANELISRGVLRRVGSAAAPAAPTPKATGGADYRTMSSDSRNPVQKFFGNLFADLSSGAEDLKEKILTPKPVFENPQNAGEWAQNAITSLPLQPLHLMGQLAMLPQLAGTLAGDTSSQGKIAENQRGLEKAGLRTPGGAAKTEAGRKDALVEGGAGLLPIPLAGEAATLATKGPAAAGQQLKQRALTDPGSFLLDMMAGGEAAHGIKTGVSSLKTPRAKTTVYGYKGDPTGDSYTQAGLGAWGNKLREGSIALSRDLEAKLKEQGVKPQSKIAVRVKGKDGKTQIVEGFWDDRTAESYKGKRLEGRVDFYRPDGNIADIDGLQVLDILTEGNKPVGTKTADRSYAHATRDMAPLRISDLLQPHAKGSLPDEARSRFVGDGVGFDGLDLGAAPPSPTLTPDMLALGAGRQPLALPPAPGLERGPEVLGQVPLDSNPEGLVPRGFTSPLMDIPAPRPAFTNTLGDAAGRANTIPAADASKVPSSLFRRFYQEEGSVPQATEQSSAPSPVLKSVRKKPTTTRRTVVTKKPTVPEPETVKAAEPIALTPEPEVTINASEPTPPAPDFTATDTGLKAKTVSNGNPDIGKTVLWKFTKTQKQGKPFKVIESGTLPNGKKWYAVEVPGRGIVNIDASDSRFGGVVEDAPTPAAKAAEAPPPTLGAAPAADAATMASVRTSLKPLQEMLAAMTNPADRKALLEEAFKSTKSLKGKLTPEQQRALIDEMASGTEVPQPNPTEGPSAPQKKVAPKRGDVVNVVIGKNPKTGEPVTARAFVVSKDRAMGRYTLSAESNDGTSERRFTANAEDVSLFERPQTKKASEPAAPRKVEYGKYAVDISDDVAITRDGEDIRTTAQSKNLIRKISESGGSDDAIAAIAKSQGSAHAEGTLVRVPGEGSTPDAIVWTYAVRGKLKRGGAATRQVSFEQPDWVKDVWEAAGNKEELRKPAEIVHNNEITSIGEPSPMAKKKAATAWEDRNTPAGKKTAPEAAPVSPEFGDKKGRKDTRLPDGTNVSLAPGAEVKVRFYRFPTPKEGPTFEGGAGIDHVEVPFKVYAFPKEAPGNVILRVSEDTVIRPHNISKTKDVILPAGTEYILKVPTRKNFRSPWAAEPRISMDEISMDAVTSIQTGPKEAVALKGVSKLKPDPKSLVSVERKAPVRDTIISDTVEKVNQVRKKGCP